MARPVTKGKDNWKKPYALSLTQSVIKWLKDKKNPSKYVNTLLEKTMIAEIEKEF